MKSDRIQILDILRGFALMGILFANIPGIARMPIPTDGEAGYAVSRFIDLAVEQRFYPIFCLLFGAGFVIFMRNAQAKGASPFKLMARRLGFLAVFGIAHQFLQTGEALLPYAIFGLIVLPLYKLPPIGLFAAAVIVLGLFWGLQTDFLVVPAVFCLGMALGKIGFFERRGQYRRALVFVWLASLLLIAPAVWAQENVLLPVWPSPLATVAGLIIAIAVTASLLLFPKTESWLAWLAPFGRMALTNYILQSVIVLLVALAAGGYESLHYTAVPAIWLAVLAAQIPLSALWLRRFHYGPLEWLWRAGTYWRRPPMLREQAAGMRKAPAV